MSKGQNLGEFELLVLAALGHLRDDAYAITIRDEIESRTGRRVSLGSIYATLGRLADKGFVVFWFSEPIQVRGGRSRRYARLTSAGLNALRESGKALARMFKGLPFGPASGRTR